MYGELAKVLLKAAIEVTISLAPRVMRWAKGLRRKRK